MEIFGLSFLKAKVIVSTIFFKKEAFLYIHILIMARRIAKFQSGLKRLGKFQYQNRQRAVKTYDRVRPIAGFIAPKPVLAAADIVRDVAYAVPENGYAL